MKPAASPRRQLALSLGVVLVAALAFIAITQAPHFQPVSSAEVEGALDHLSTVAFQPDSR